ncbi:FG-GAP-like repeat-containing protein [Streptomyces sp. NPDC059828]|uniref:FG-GAP-like repeat-containing protein n=1 Tax=Streptomyces sp. NPDC059828 TaxID=3346965 RepID=UPI00365BB14A
MRYKALTAAAACAATVLGITALAPAATAAGSSPKATAKPAAPVGDKAAAAADGTADFNGDGYPDLAIGAHTAPAGAVKRAGVVTIAYGSPTGLRYETASVISKATPGVPGDPVEDERWREVRGHGDLDGDGYDDLVVRWVEKNMVLWGGKDGITGTATAMPTGSYTASDPKLLGGGFGVGDVNGDGVDDFVSRSNHGLGYGPSVLLGPINRTTGKPAGVWTRDTDELDKVGTSELYVGDTTGDGIDDVVVSGGVPLGSGATSGVVLKGSAKGLVKGSAFNGPYQLFTDTRSAFGDLNKDGRQDLVTAYPEQNKIYVAYGSPDGLANGRSYTQSSSGVPGIDEAGDQFGSAVAVGDTDNDGYDDVVIGASYETGSDPATTAKSGAITVLRGSASGLTTSGAASFTQNAAGIPSTSENNDYFGAALALTDTDKNGSAELYVGGNGEDGFKGRVWKLQTGAGVTGAGATSFDLTALGGPAVGGNFGYRISG